MKPPRVRARPSSSEPAGSTVGSDRLGLRSVEEDRLRGRLRLGLDRRGSTGAPAASGSKSAGSGSHGPSLAMASSSGAGLRLERIARRASSRGLLAPAPPEHQPTSGELGRPGRRAHRPYRSTPPAWRSAIAFASSSRRLITRLTESSPTVTP